MIATAIPNPHGCEMSSKLSKRINNEKDARFFITESIAYRSIKVYVDLLTESIRGTGNKTLNKNYTIQNEVFRECATYIDTLDKCCDETELTAVKSGTSLRFGHVAFRDWYDKMKAMSREFVESLAAETDEQFREELFTYLVESFGNRMRIDYGTGHELNFIIFTMGLSGLVMKSKTPNQSGDLLEDLVITTDKLKSYVGANNWDIHALFAHKYLRLCRKVQAKFRLEPAGSRGVYNIDDFQFLPFLFGSSQLSGDRLIPTSDFYQREVVSQNKDDYVFFEAVDFILSNKKGPFEEHSYTLWTYTNTGSWEKICRIIRIKFNDDVLSPFPIIQHLLFGKHILRWASLPE